MRARDRVPRFVGAAALCVALAACAGSGGPAGSPSVDAATPTPAPTRTPIPSLTAAPSGFPTKFTDRRPASLPRLSQVDGGLRGHLDASLVSDDGLTATYTATWLENRVAAAKIKCGGGTYANVFTVENPTQTSQVTFPGWGTGTFVATRRVVVYPSSINGSSPPLCEDVGGGTFTITFRGGSAAGVLTGSWTETATGTVKLLPASAATRAATASP